MSVVKLALLLLKHADDMVKAGRTLGEVGAVLKKGRALITRLKTEKRRATKDEWDEINASIAVKSKRLG